MWFGARGGPPTVRNVVSHFRRILEADLSIPIILRADGRILDGLHRLAKAMVEGHTTIRAVRFTEMPAPDSIEPLAKQDRV